MLQLADATGQESVTHRHRAPRGDSNVTVSALRDCLCSKSKSTTLVIHLNSPQMVPRCTRVASFPQPEERASGSGEKAEQEEQERRAEQASTYMQHDQSSIVPLQSLCPFRCHPWLSLALLLHPLLLIYISTLLITHLYSFTLRFFAN